ncbi:MAG: cell division protein FtsB [Thiotrichales bacterium SG8_50]|nr:MAG: cell division protein FtsB [Thiotrichales bacterium SG8_50]
MRAMRVLLYSLTALLVLLQYDLWFGEGGMVSLVQLRDSVAAQTQENERLQERNAVLAAEVSDLKQGVAAIEERARSELGMIRRGETYYQVIDPH